MTMSGSDQVRTSAFREESAHAIAEVIQRAPKLGKDKLIIINLSGRGDKDVAQVAAKVALRMPQ